MIAAPTEVIAASLRQHGICPRRFDILSPLGERKGRRLAYRVDAEDGRTIKVREFESAAVASAIFELRAGLEDAFARAVARYGSVIIEEWIDGVPLTDNDEERLLEEAGALLGRLHSRRPNGMPASLHTSKWRSGAESDLTMLARVGQLAPADAAALRIEIEQCDPLLAPAAVIHLDFCAENMLIDRCGKLRVIDNEQLAIEPAGLDLGRTFDRWPIAAAGWSRFHEGYLSAAPGAPGPTGFWRIVAALVGARVLLQRKSPRLPASLALLQRLSRGQCLSEERRP